MGSNTYTTLNKVKSMEDNPIIKPINYPKTKAIVFFF